ncbi:PAS domain-containing protein [Methanoculleus sp. FWC-SCC1]|uniref:PAS domain-containing protein n=1 Tax=Methanoculleus frigidifontis TaxID=2584085 RepID=A0ABT8M943_9EURY|nr:methyl-accepting chemotaxis protein [Methanoculleus sp. FWC-SCC1]MDN7024448.1 PAS domain-containing protein [Methanoculleus sp. FWC-SCC1]
MTDKPGRKALFTGAVGTGVSGTTGQAPAEVPPAIEAVLGKAVAGDFSGRIDPAGIPEAFRSLAASINTLLEKVEGEEQEVQQSMQLVENIRKTSDEIIGQNPMPMLVVDADFRITVTNEAYAKLSGIPEEKITTMTLRDFRIVSQKGDGIGQAVKGKRKAFGEVVVELPAGTFTLEQYGIPLLDDRGDIERILIVYNDVTKQREEEEELKTQMDEIAELQKRSETIVEQNPMPILVVDPEMKVTVTNDAFVRLSGFAREKVMAMTLRDFRVLSQKGDGIKKAIGEKQRSYGEVVVEFPTGTLILEQYGIPILSDKGELTGLLIVYNDVTRQREEEEELKTQMDEIAELQKRSETIVEQNPMPILVVDPEMKVTVTNDAFVRLSGFAREKVMAMTLRDFRVLSQKGDGIRKAIGEKQRSYGEVTVEFPTGTYALEQYGIPILSDKGELTGLLVVYNNVTELRREEEEIKRMQHRVDTMIKDNPLAIAVLRGDKSRIDINDEYVRMWRGTREETLAKKLYDYDITVIGGEDFYACYETKKRARTDVLAKWPDGVQKYLTLNAIPILDENGEIEMAFYVWNDWTEVHDKAEEAKTAQARVDTMIQDNPLAIAVLRADKSRLDINDEYARMWRGTREETLAKKLYDYDIEVLDGDHFYACYETKKRATTNVRVKWPDGVRKYLTLNAIPILDANGDIEMAFYVWNDWTELHEKMNESTAAQQRVDTMIKDNPLAIAVLRADKSRIDINDEYARMWRGTREETLAKKLYDYDITVIDGDDFYACYETKKRARTDVLAKWPDGVQKYLTLNAIPILDKNGDIEMAFYVWNDWTDMHDKVEEVQLLMKNAQEENAKLAASADELGSALDAMAKGNLTAFVNVGEDDPLKKVKEDYNTSLTAIRSTLQQVVKSALQVEQTTQEVSKSSDEIIRATEQVALSTQQSSEDARRQLEKIEEIGQAITDLSASIEEIASTSQEVMEHASKAAKEGNDAAALGQVATSKMQLVEEVSLQSVQEITDLNAQMLEINNIVKLITDIANQTNLLALNAAIEAARAGEHGRGFAVVAGEIRNLAGESKGASQDIENLIRSIQASSEKTATSMRSSHQEIQEGIESVNKAIEALNRIIDEAEVVAHGITEITKATEDQATSTNNVMQKMEDSTDMTKENMGRTEDMAALAEEVSASTEEVGSASHELAAMTEQLKKMMEQFRLN